MSQKNGFRKALRGVDSAIKQGTARALNRASSSARTKIARVMREETGLKTEHVKARMRGSRAKVDSLGVVIGLAVKFGVAINRLGAKTKRVLARYPDGTKRARTGVTVKVGRQARELAPGAFAIERPGGVAVVGRQSQFSGDLAKTYRQSPIQGSLVKLKSDVFREQAEANQKSFTTHLHETFNRIVGHEIEFAVAKKFKENK